MSNYKNRIIGNGTENPKNILANPKNWRVHTEYQRASLKGVLEEIGWVQQVIINKNTGHLIDGHLRVETALKNKETEVPVIYVDLTENEEKIALAVIDPIAALATTNQDGLNQLLSEIEARNDSLQDFLDTLLVEDEDEKEILEQAEVRTKLSDQFLVPPFSVLDGRQGYWLDRKRTWLSLGITSEKGRGQDGDATKSGMTFSVSAQHGSVYDRKNLIEKRDGKDYSWKEFAEKYPEEIKAVGDSIFDPVLVELANKWYCPPHGTVLDPFAGGSVRGIVTVMTGREYTGIELRKEQVEANRINWEEIDGQVISKEFIPEDYTERLTKVEQRGDYFFKRDDMFAIAGSRGGKVRSCWILAQGAVGLVTAGSRQSPQVNIVANIAKRLGIPCRVHTPEGELTPELISARRLGAEIIQHKAGYNSVIVARSREDAKALGWTEIPFGMECKEAIKQTRGQVENIPEQAKRLVVPVGSGMSLSGILHGLNDNGIVMPVLGVMVGADPTKRLDEYAPKNWREMVTLINAGVDYHDRAKTTEIEGVVLDPIYEAKCIPFLEKGDCLWCVGIRQTESVKTEKIGGQPEWINADSRRMNEVLPEGKQFDLIFSCPPYADLEVYSDDPDDISNKEYDEFLALYREIIQKSVDRLKDDRFAVWVVGDVRDKKGYYHDFISDSIKAFTDAGMHLYNEGIYLQPIGSLPMRAGNIFRAARKLGKAHQNLLVFAKGQPEKISIEGITEAVAEQFEEHREMIDSYQKVLTFIKGDAKKATENMGTVIIAEDDAE